MKKQARKNLIILSVIIVFLFAVGFIVRILGGDYRDEDVRPEHIFILGLIGGYFLPMIVAFKRHHRQAAPIAVINLFLGWTLLGWVVALVWALSALDEKEGINKN